MLNIRLKRIVLWKNRKSLIEIQKRERTRDKFFDRDRKNSNKVKDKRSDQTKSLQNKKIVGEK